MSIFPNLVYTSPDGDTIDFNDGERIGITGAIEGLGIPSTNHQSTQTPLAHGEILRSSVSDARLVTVPVIMNTPSVTAISTLSRDWNRVLNPWAAGTNSPPLGTLTYVPYEGGPIYEIDAIFNGPFSFRERTLIGTAFRRLEFYCPQPFWREIPAATAKIRVGEAGLSIPWSIPSSIPRSVSTVTFSNTGDLPSPLLLTIEGPATGLKITNLSTNEYMEFGAVIENGSTLEIDGLNKRVMLDGQNAARWITPGSTFIDARPGSNEYRAEVQSGGPNVSLVAYSLYVGVE